VLGGVGVGAGAGATGAGAAVVGGAGAVAGVGAGAGAGAAVSPEPRPDVPPAAGAVLSGTTGMVTSGVIAPLLLPPPVVSVDASAIGCTTGAAGEKAPSGPLPSLPSLLCWTATGAATGSAAGA
jgi:hypothetical protein